MISDAPFLRVKYIGTTEYADTLAAMQRFTAERHLLESDQCWITSHPPVFTHGIASKPEHVLQKTAIPVVQSDRGGQITYHGPGQLVLYWLCNLKRLNLGPRRMVQALESGVINGLAAYGITGHRTEGAPGVYVDRSKIASIGLRVKRGCSYHGLSVNLDMDLTPFQAINPCGFPGLTVTQVADQLRTVAPDTLLCPEEMSQRMIITISEALGYPPDAIHWEQNETALSTMDSLKDSVAPYTQRISSSG